MELTTWISPIVIWAAMDPNVWLPVLISSLLSSGFVGGIVAFLKAGREKDRISVQAAEGALVVQEGVLKSLEDENVRLKVTNETLRGRVRELEDLCSELQGLG